MDQLPTAFLINNLLELQTRLQNKTEHNNEVRRLEIYMHCAMHKIKGQLVSTLKSCLMLRTSLYAGEISLV